MAAQRSFRRSRPLPAAAPTDGIVVGPIAHRWPDWRRRRWLRPLQHIRDPSDHHDRGRVARMVARVRVLGHHRAHQRLAFAERPFPQTAAIAFPRTNEVTAAHAAHHAAAHASSHTAADTAAHASATAVLHGHPWRRWLLLALTGLLPSKADGGPRRWVHVVGEEVVRLRRIRRWVPNIASH
jgi:hypothetical protein